MIRDLRFAELTPAQLYQILRLRNQVFVVEQGCPYIDIDGRDDEPATRHLFIEDDDGLAAYLRLLDDGEALRIGRVMTRPDARRRGLAAELVHAALASGDGPWVLGAQAHLVGWYSARGFEVSGEAYDEDGIAHVPMRRAAL